jgi:hypothetical protein
LRNFAEDCFGADFTLLFTTFALFAPFAPTCGATCGATFLSVFLAVILSRIAIAAPSSAGERTVVIPAASSATNFAAAVPFPPATIAPACPMRLPGGAATPAIYATTGLLTCLAM